MTKYDDDYIDALVGDTDLEISTAIQQQIRVAASRHGWILFRNNSGACINQKTGRLVRYGLANDSAKLNRIFKSSDLIGIRPVTIHGTVLGQFVALEVKRPGWSWDDRSEAQQRFGNRVTECGGHFQFVTSVEEVQW